MRLSAKWFQFFHGPDEERKSLEEAIRHSTIVLDLLTRHLQKELDTLTKRPEADYESPSWAFKQAHINGQIKTLNDLLKMTNLGDQSL